MLIPAGGPATGGRRSHFFAEERFAEGKASSAEPDRTLLISPSHAAHTPRTTPTLLIFYAFFFFRETRKGLPTSPTFFLSRCPRLLKSDESITRVRLVSVPGTYMVTV